VRSRVLIVLALSAFAACPPARAADWTLEGGDEARAIALEPCLSASANDHLPPHEDSVDKFLRHRRCDGGADAIGRLTLVVHNGADKPLRLRLRYARADGHVATMPGNSALARLWIARPPSREIRDAIDPVTVDPIKALSTLPTGTAHDRPRVETLIDHAHTSPNRRELDRLAAAFTLLITRPESNAVLTRADAAELLNLVRKARTHRAARRHLIHRAFAIAVARSAVVVPPHSASSLPVRFALPGSRPPSVLTGVIQVRERSPGSAVVTVPVAAKAPDAKSVVAMPAAITVTTARSRFQRIELVGGDVSEFVVAGRRRPTATLHDGDGHDATITISPFTRYRADRNRAWATVAVDDRTKPGDYQGDIALFRSSPAGPKLAVVVRAGRPEEDGRKQALLGIGAGLLIAALLANKRWLRFGSMIGAAVVAVFAGLLVWAVFHFAIYGPTWGSTNDSWLVFGLGATTALLLLLVLVPQRGESYSPRRR
jgi:hypothetical protein